MAAADFVGGICSGTFKSFNVKKGWGFLSCPDFPEDLFVSFNTAPEVANLAKKGITLDGQTASFTVQESKTKPGQYEATAVHVDQYSVDTGSYPQEQGDASQFVGQRLAGVIKSFNDKNGWGFLSCTNFSDDVFVSFKIAPQLKQCAPMGGSLQGVPASFVLVESKSKPGQYEASEVHVDVAMGASARVGQWCFGMVKSFNMKNGWGFLRCADFAEDVFVSLNTAPELRTIVQQFGTVPEGHPVNFLLQNSKSRPGEYEAGAIAVMNGGMMMNGGMPGRMAKGGCGCKGGFGPMMPMVQTMARMMPYAAKGKGQLMMW